MLWSLKGQIEKKRAKEVSRKENEYVRAQTRDELELWNLRRRRSCSQGVAGPPSPQVCGMRYAEVGEAGDSDKRMSIWTLRGHRGSSRDVLAHGIPALVGTGGTMFRAACSHGAPRTI